MNRETKKLLFDALSACRAIRQFVQDHTFNDYEGDLILRSAVERQFEIVGEAMNQAWQIDEMVVDMAPDLPKIIGLRNRLIHGYATVNNQIIWSIVQNDLPALEEQLETALK